MYEHEMKERAYHQQGAALGQGIGGQYANAAYQGANLTSPPKPLISSSLLNELQSLLEKARMIENRQSDLKDRIFGSVPKPNSEGKAECGPNGFLHEANNKIQSLHLVLDRIIGLCNDLERLA